MTSHGISSDVSLAADILLSGGIVGLPTETVYGLAACALQESAVHRIFDVKGRPRSHPLIVHLSSSADYHQWGLFNEVAESLAQSFWPGPLTLLVPRTSHVPDWVTGGRDTVALRVPNHSLAQELLTRTNTGLVAPSANKFGKVSPTSARHVLDDLGDDVDLILDGGESEVGLESTIVECTANFEILRPGQISIDDIIRVTGHTPKEPTGPSRAPGMLASHYAPHARVVIVDSVDEAQALQQRESSLKKVHIVFFSNVDSYAEHLYDELRMADHNKCELVIAVRAPDQGIGIAINDRLSKAAAGR
jgi:L-threonylcarbamoyladenylate synthase